MSEGVLYSEDGSDEGVWDDTLLVKAYSKAVNASEQRIQALKVKEKSVNQYPSSSKDLNGHEPSAGKQSPWVVGMPCRAVYSVDGKEYEATIDEINHERGTCCVVYLGYGNVEEVDLSSLKTSGGDQARIKQEQIQNNFKQEPKLRKPSSSSRFGFIPPPPAVPILDGMPLDEADAFSAMLMSWYMSGYHTGYYHGLKDNESKKTSHQGS